MARQRKTSSPGGRGCSYGSKRCWGFSLNPPAAAPRQAKVEEEEVEAKVEEEVEASPLRRPREKIDLDLRNIIHGGEFGEVCVTRIWPAFLLKRWLGDEVNIHSEWLDDLKEEVWSQFSDSYHFPAKEGTGKSAVLKLFSKMRRDFPRELVNAKMDWSWVKKDPRKYVCFIPCLSERWLKGDEFGGTAGGRSLPFLEWLELKELVNHYGYEVIGVGWAPHTGLDRLDRVDRNRIGNETMFLETLKKPVRTEYLQRQLEVMSGAEFTLSMGGGGFLAPSFGMPAISVDEFWGLYVPGWLPLHDRPDVSVLYWGKERDKMTLQEKLDATRVFVREEIKRRLAP